jgi:hypothetical protein
MNTDLQDAKRYRYLRDMVFQGMKRGDMPEAIGQYFYDMIDSKHPTPGEFDKVMDYLLMMYDYEEIIDEGLKKIGEYNSQFFRKDDEGDE